MIYWQLLGVYLKIGIFGFGGGYAMLSLIQYEVVDTRVYRCSGYLTNDPRPDRNQ